MSTVQTFDGKQVIEPGAYAQTKNGIPISASNASFGNVCIIDTGICTRDYDATVPAYFGGGSGVNGTFQNSKQAIYEFTTPVEFRNFIRGGMLWDLAPLLFRPTAGVTGTSKIFYISAKTSTPAQMVYTFAGGGANGGTLTIKPLTEGLGANGVATSGVLTRGFGAKMIAGVIDPTKFILQFFVGTFRGKDKEGNPYDGLNEINCRPQQITQSIEFANIATVITWMQTDPTFLSNFKLTGFTVAGTGVVDSTDLSSNVALKLATGGSEAFNSTDLDKVLENITELDNSFFLSDRWGYHPNTEVNYSTGSDSQNIKILTHIEQDAENKKFLVVGGGKDASQFDQSTQSSFAIASIFNSRYTIVAHGGIKIPSQLNNGQLRDVEAIYFAALALGRLAGLEPQTSATFKEIGVQGVTHELSKKQRENALQKGVMHLRYVNNSWRINQSINTLQQNTIVYNPDGSSFLVSSERIAAQLNKELTQNARAKFVGLNRNTASPADVKAFVEGYLIGRTATKTQDNLIISFQNVTVRPISGDSYDIQYGFVPNAELAKLFFTGYTLDFTTTA